MRKIGPKQIDTNLIPRHCRGFKLRCLARNSHSAPVVSRCSSSQPPATNLVLKRELLRSVVVVVAGTERIPHLCFIRFLFSLVFHSSLSEEKQQQQPKNNKKTSKHHPWPQIGLFVSIAKGEIIRFLNYSFRYHLDYLSDGRGGRQVVGGGGVPHIFLPSLPPKKGE